MQPRRPSPLPSWPSGRPSRLVRRVDRPVVAELLGDHRVGLVPAALVFEERLDLLIDGRVHEHGEDRRRGAVDRHRDARLRVAEVEAGVELLHVVERADAHARIADLAVDVGPLVGVAAVERDAVERRREPLGGEAEADEVEAAVRPLGRALAGEHPRRVLARALEREDAGGEGEVAGEVFEEREAEPLAGVLGARQRDARHLRPAQRLVRQRLADFAPAHGVDEFVLPVLRGEVVPVVEDAAAAAVELVPPVVGHLAEAGSRAPRGPRAASRRPAPARPSPAPTSGRGRPGLRRSCGSRGRRRRSRRGSAGASAG